MAAIQEALPLPNVSDFCTIQYAAAKLGRSERTVRRWVADGVLAGQKPRAAAGEVPPTLLCVAHVTELRAALSRIGRARA